MNHEEHIRKMTEEALNSLDGVRRAGAKPFLLTRINARLAKTTETVWERTGRLISRPVIAITGLCLVIGINAFIMIKGNKTTDTAFPTEQLTASDDLSTNVAILYDSENIEP